MGVVGHLHQHVLALRPVPALEAGALNPFFIGDYVVVEGDEGRHGVDHVQSVALDTSAGVVEERDVEDVGQDGQLGHLLPSHDLVVVQVQETERVQV